jgi:hypothetical protein
MEEADILRNLLSQYRASLAMMKHVIEVCPDELWLAADDRNRFWQIAYHALFYTHLYASQSETEFTPWKKHRPECRLLGSRPEGSATWEPYSKAELLEYLQICSVEVEDKLSKPGLEQASGFDWLPFNRLELHLYNIRHLQHHTGQLADRLRAACGIGAPWVRLA